ncbi:glycosyltransferase family 1 protein [Mesorhizobium sp. B2-1-3A]|uniref:glycosyltransferase family 4 protein n=1 Tax=Mesorhizobium sp. B2-1-3A TaxID=2589971 RepID=UPI001129E12B|nr:glycosyltransferase family 1 protein [Mesorhizobium sp. B2-1-3A]TPN01693.1 glycosyltransferase family 4 protein [Mesorhizobium sp. B2-1-3A]
MRVWFDGQCLQTSSRERGIGRYALELIRSVSLHFPDVELCISFNAIMTDDLLRAQDLVSGLIRAENIYSWHSAATTGEAISGQTPQRQLSEIALAHHVRCIAPDIAVVLSTFEGGVDMAVPLNPGLSLNCPVVGIFYDAIPFRFPDEYLSSKITREHYERRFGNQAHYDGLLCISEFTKSEAEDIFKTVPAFCIDAGMPTQLQNIFNHAYKTEEAPKRNPNDILYVGALDWRKNVDKVVDAFSILNERGFNRLRLVIAGSYHQDAAQEIKAKWKRLGLQERNLSFLGQVGDRELCDLYLGSGFSIQPSLMEGFGLTALEATYFHCPVLGSNIGALKDIIGSPLALFDPMDANDMASVIQNAISHDDVRERILNTQINSPSNYTWKRTSKLFMEAVHSVILNKNESYKKHSPLEAIEDSRVFSARLIENIDSSIDEKIMSLTLAEPKIGLRPRLIVDATSTILMDHKTGIQRVVRQICRHLAEFPPSKDVSRVIGFCNDELGWFDANGNLDERPAKRRSRKLDPRSNDTMLLLDSTAWGFFGLYLPFLDEMRIQGAQVISCLYDIVPITMPATCDPGMPPVFANWFKAALVYSTGFVCISRAVADELHAMLGAIAFPRRMKIGYWQLGADFSGQTMQTSPSRKAKERPVFLMVGTLEPRKGHRVVLDAFEQLWAENVDVALVIVGKIGWGSKHVAERIQAHPEYGKRLTWHSTAGDAELVQLYNECDALIAASFAEGFGLPLVEAAHFGMPVLASDIPVFREVAGSASTAHFFESGSPTALSSTVKEFLKHHRGVAARKAEHATWPTWAESAAQLETVVLSEKWYKIYEPLSPKPNVARTDIGHVRMTSPLEGTERLHSLRLVDGPFSEDAENLKIVVAVQNLSNSIWSSEGAYDGSLGVTLSYHIVDRDGTILLFDGPRCPIPLVLIPGDTHYMAVNVPRSWKARGAGFIDIELVQEGVSWFGTPLRVAM